jgi:hypothetical protein
MEKIYENAILWPANINAAGVGMPMEEADVRANRNFLKEKGAVYWDSSAKRKELTGPFWGYIYNTLPVGKVEYKCLIDFVINRDTLLEMPEEEVFIPHFRKQCFKGHFEDGTPHNPSQTWIRISKFVKLMKSMQLQDFEKLDGTTVKNIRGGFVYILSP